MRLKRLELLGFKSFADKTVLDFGQNALTGIVGPNGCGKSNVVDAIRWVLGERRPTSMRGAEMADVIFKGCVSRPRMGVAEVTMVLDNEDGSLEEAGPEVAITRRVFQSGEGEYLIDGDRCRLKDLRELLFDTGLGSRGYSVLEQGKIDAVLSANAAERRSIFEEAAGISRYRQRRAEAENKLKRTERDMTRLDDLLGELRTRVRSLKIQAGKAERYVEARAEWGEKRTRLGSHQLFTFGEELNAVQAELEGLQSHQERLRTDRAQREEEAQTQEAERAGLSAELESLMSESARIVADGRALEERRAQLHSRIQSWRHSSREESERSAALSVKLEERQAELQSVEARLTEARAELERAEAETEACRTGLDELRGEYRKKRTEVETQNEVVLGLLHEKTASQNTVVHLEEALEPTAERKQRSEERLARVVELLGELTEERTRAFEATEEARLALSAAEETAGELEKGIGEREAELAEVDEELQGLEDRATERRALIEALLDRESEREGLDRGSRRVLADEETARRVRGLVADHLSCETHYARALDAVLGEWGRALVVQGQDDAEALLKALADADTGSGEGGGASESGDLLALAITLAPMVQPGVRRTPPQLSGITGRLIDHVSARPESEALVLWMLGDVWVAEDLATAFRARELEPGFRYVTLEGELLSASGIVGGRRALTHGPVGRRSRAAELRAEVERLESEIAVLASRREERAERLAAARSEVGKARERVEASRETLAEAEGALSTAGAREKDQEKSREHLVVEQAAHVAEWSKLETELETARREKERTEREFGEQNERFTQLDAERLALEERAEERTRAMSRAEVESTRLREQVEGLDQRLSDLTHVVSEGAIEIERAKRLTSEHEANAARAEEDHEELGAESAKLAEQREALDLRLKDVRGVVEAGQAAVELARREVDDIGRELEACGERLGAVRLEAQRIELSREELERRLFEELELQAEALLRDFEPDPELAEASALRELEKDVKELKRQLDKLGPVNMEAVHELEEVGGRLDFMEQQYADLEGAKRSLGETLRTIDAETKELFVATFEEVRGNFQRIFRQLFGGGRADVRLEEGVDPLEAGVDIIARPPGREMLSIGLLSGGQRTLTALALLFAVFEARPSPFCVLDEVDAALDDANIERFLTMLTSFADTTQFVVVTHNKGTMSACQALFGVTMQTKGVSRYVRVELDDVDAFVPEATGGGKAKKGGKGAKGSKSAATGGAAPSLLPPVPDPVSEEEDDETPALPDPEPAEAAEGEGESDAESDPSPQAGTFATDESGEPIVEVVPASVGEDGSVQGGTLRDEAPAELVEGAEPVEEPVEAHADRD